VKPAAIKFSLLTLAVSTLLFSAPAAAIVGGAKQSDDGVGRSVVTIVGSGGTFCSGALIAPDLVLTAAHCLQPGAVYKILEYGPDKQPLLRDTRNVAFHPGFDMKAINAHRASADVALLQLEAAPMDKKPSAFGPPQTSLSAGNRFTVAGVGVTVRGDGKSGGTIRIADLIATGHPGSLQIRLVDPVEQGAKPGLGACTGDSGAPVFEDQQGAPAIIGIVSWSTGPNNSAGCGGLTGVTPLTLYRDWIVQTARQWGSALAR
jgi:secreted trypsin-like serine protease